MKHYQDKIVAWAQSNRAVRAVIMTGSMAQPKTPRTRWSDLDIELYFDDPAPYLNSEDWIHGFGEVWVILPLQNPGWHPTRLTWFAGGEKVDFSIDSVDGLKTMIEGSELSEMYQRGYQVLVDKDGLAAQLAPSPFKRPTPQPPTFEEFDFTVREFWYESMHVVQYITAGELWAVKFRDTGIKFALLTMLEWHGQFVLSHTVYHTGKRLYEWSDSWHACHNIFGHFDAADSWQAFFATINLFERVAREVAAKLDFAYPVARVEKMKAYMRDLYAEKDGWIALD